ncbi:hypothetical protein GJ654_13020 [Rhodoblastus acidophilus]|uniref:Uncharacterized protein n=1 Tax=Rhodoblastus acidophilus TaxID=1074 RepID=A0A6N8DNL1_RHOAC|nr:hypothetical protein [Rhodoblastus acidophilus]MCW2272439.1 hypothetical protein [Rhodoblastus acidophilus]MTV31908.1 hypothetical protein [Rhodoblastus acidophilus]
MSFLLRCLFWLGLVVSQISDREGLSLASLTQPARDGLTAGAEQLKDRAVASCRDNTAACLALAAKAGGLMAPARPADEPAGGDTLRDADRAPAWRLPRAKKDGA